MALSDKQKHQAIFYLGWPGTTIVEGSTGYSGTIVRRLTVNLNEYVETQVIRLLDRVEGIDNRLDASLDRIGTESIGDIKLRSDEAERLRNERRRVIRELSNVLDVPILQGSSNNVVA